MSLYFQPRNPKLVQVEGVNLLDEKIELEEKVDDLEHRSQEIMYACLPFLDSLLLKLAVDQRYLILVAGY
uniref:DNA-binding WRKY n=1 Tax=Tanacetum cinerariifolium TaxID=118510 RepID=A0A699J5N3_TANCI|nr:DNA-binding WRKY [Tanacetum cinerariifolium]